MKNLLTLDICRLLCVSLITIMAGCSEDNPASTQLANSKSASTNNSPAKPHHPNHIDQGEASDSVKSQFINQFAKKCVDRELKNSVNQDIDNQRATANCECVAKKIAEDLSDLDAEKYLQEHEDTQTLEIKFDHAVYFCIQNKTLPKGPHLFGKDNG